MKRGGSTAEPGVEGSGVGGAPRKNTTKRMVARAYGRLAEVDGGKISKGGEGGVVLGGGGGGEGRG